MHANTRNRFAAKLSPYQERRRRLYLLDTEPRHSLQVFGVPQYLPSQIHGYNSVTTADLVHHHERMQSLIQSGHLDLTKFDADGLENSLAFVFGFEVPSKSAGEPPQRIRCLQIYFAAPASDDLPACVLGNKTAREGSAARERARQDEEAAPKSDGGAP
jgi:hypothetical protein